MIPALRSLLGAAVLLALAGCTPGAEGRLGRCPDGDAAWEAALTEAAEAERLVPLAELAERLTERCAGRWEPAWAAGQALFESNRKPTPELLERMRGHWETGLARAEALGDPVGESRCADRLAMYHKLSGDFELAERMVERALAAAERAGRDDLQAFAYNTRAGMLRSRVRLAEAVVALENAARHLERAGRAVEARRSAYNRALLLEDTGQLHEQRQVLERIWDEAREREDAVLLPRVAIAMGSHHFALDEPGRAAEWFRKVEPGSGQESNAALGLGRIALREGRLEEAARLLDQAVRDEPRPDSALFPRTFRAEVALRSGDAAGAIERLGPVIDAADAAGIRDVAALARMLEGTALLGEAGRTDAAIRRFREAVGIVEGGGEGLGPFTGGMTYLRQRAEPFAALAGALARRGAPGDAEEALQVVERAHSRTLRRVLGADDERAARIDEAALRAGLHPGELLVDFLVGQDHGVVLALRRDGLIAAPIPGWEELREPLARYRSALSRPLRSAEARRDPQADFARDVPIGHALYDALLGPIGPWLAAAERIYVVPDQDLALLPFAALPEGDTGSPTVRFLGERVEIAVLPMAARAGAWSSSGGSILLAGDPRPDPEGHFPALPLAAREAAEIAAMWRGAPVTTLLGEELVESRVRALALDHFGILHFATHAVASSNDPDRCAVILSAGEKLNLREILEFRLGPSLVVLSACRTGEGEVIPGEGVVGLTWAFLRAGARAVAASLWSVEDEATTDLMVRFHGHLRAGRSPVAALAAAQREIARSRPHPVHWAPFVMILGPAGDGADAREGGADRRSGTPAR